MTGVANSFEASGPCRLVVGGQEVALEGYQSDGWMEDRLFPFEVDLPLDGVTGEVVVQCETDDPSGGAEGNGPAIDTKTIIRARSVPQEPSTGSPAGASNCVSTRTSTASREDAP